jgi:branched-chain amino acid transport system permease protein
VALVLVGLLNGTYLLFLVSLAGVYMLVAMGLNVQWGYAGIINFSVAAFFGIGAYAAALATGSNSPLAGGLSPAVGLVVAVGSAVVLALLIGLPTLTLRGDYLAIATLGLAEVVRLVLRSEPQWTNGTAGLFGIPELFVGVPGLSGVTGRVETAVVNAVLVGVAVLVVWLLLRRVHRSPWGRVQRLIRTDEDLAAALGKDTRAFRLQSFVIGSVIMALAGVLYAHVIAIVEPGLLDPIQTFYVWIAVIIGGTGSDRGAMIGALLILAIQQGTRAVPDWAPVAAGPLRLLLVGLLIILVIQFRPQGALPPRRELIWPGAGGETDG